MRIYKVRNIRDRFWSKVNRTSTCWLWAAATDKDGYGAFMVGSKKNHTKRMKKSHRISYQWAKGPIANGLEIDHICRVRECVNPDHLEAVTHRINWMRGDNHAAKNMTKTHCRKGHEYSGKNLRVNSLGKRCCKMCDRDRKRIKRTQVKIIMSKNSSVRRTS